MSAARFPRWAPLALFVTLAVCALITYLDAHVDWVAEKHRVDATREATQDQFLALRLLVQQAGYPVRTTGDTVRLADLPLDTTLVLVDEVPETLIERVEPRLVDWVKRGGHLVTIVPGIDQNDPFTTTVGLKRVGEHVSDATSTYTLEGRSVGLGFERCDVFRVKAPLVWGMRAGAYKPYSQEDEDEDDEPVLGRPAAKTPPVAATDADFAAARWRLGKGVVSAACDINPLFNEQLGQKGHAEFALRLVLEPGHEKVVFAKNLDETEQGLLGWLWYNAGSALAGMAVLIVLVLWQAMPRLGAILPEPPPARPGLREHLRAMAAFLLREKDFVPLLQGLREEVLRQAARHANTPEPEMDAIAQLAGVSPDALHAAFNQTPTDRPSYLRAAATLAQVMDVLRAHRPMSRTPQRSKRS